MPKKLRTEPIYLAPQILAYRELDNSVCVIDKRDGQKLNPNDIDDKIYIYERQVREWFMNRANSLIQRKQNDFIVLMITMAYIEGSEQYRQGESSRDSSRRFFRNGMKRIFGDSIGSDHNIDMLYNHLRCGLFHNGMSGDAVVLNRRLKKPIIFSSRGTIDINPRLFLSTISTDFNNYIEELKNKNNDELRQHFNSMFCVV